VAIEYPFGAKVIRLQTIQRRPCGYPSNLVLYGDKQEIEKNMTEGKVHDSRKTFQEMKMIEIRKSSKTVWGQDRWAVSTWLRLRLGSELTS